MTQLEKSAMTETRAADDQGVSASSTVRTADSSATRALQLAPLEAAVARVNIIAVIDPSGRGGNMFFLTIFDDHPEIACCPLVQYTYSYIVAAFGDETEIDSRAAHEFVTRRSYFRLIYNEPTSAGGELIERMGGSASAPIDRAAVRRAVDEYFAARSRVSRRELVAAPLLAYAAARGRDLDALRYVMVADAISLREEDVTHGFSGRILDRIVDDFPVAKLVQLVRDPRATFASPRHQFVNALGNMYAITPATYFKRLRSLAKADLQADNGCVYLYWLLYLRTAGSAARRQMAHYASQAITVRNEDLNTRFPWAMQRLADWLGVDYLMPWRSNDFVPTIIGVPWAGIGAYNNRYQRSVHGLLANDSDDVARRATGPNVYVTQRWRRALSRREIELIERLFYDEIEELGYEILHDRKDRSDVACLLRTSLLPFVGELPTLAWLRKGAMLGMREFINRLFYAMAFPPFYVVSRVLLWHFVLRRKFFAPSRGNSVGKAS